ncbi:hypothetical protein [Streptomyces sp. R41]|uniref:MarR family transcriptional regulator n=1 Tax=Streptomyces sp. R41 TaxID=3238632 RepID=A0AB39RPZ9_9ACTN
MELTVAGRDCLRRAERTRRDMERRFLAPLDEEAAARPVRALRVLAVDERVTE